MFGVMIKDVEAMDASILKGEPASGKKQKVADHMPSHPEILLKVKRRTWTSQETGADLWATNMKTEKS